MAFFVATQIILFFLFFQKTKKVRESLLAQHVVISALVALGCIGLSFFHLLTPPLLQGYWALTLLVAVFLFVRKSERKNPFTETKNAMYAIASSFKEKTTKVTAFSVLLIFGIGWIALATLLLGIFSPPNNHDAMTAHMAKIVFWTGNQSVAFYPTSELPQIHLGPFSSYKILNFFFLLKADWLSNFVQWEAMIFLLVAVSLLLKKLRFTFQQQLITLFLIVSMPMLILQASSAQNDLVVASFTFAFVYYCWDFLEKKRVPFWQATLMGIVLGLAVLTKVTALIYLSGIGIVFAFLLLKERKVFFTRRNIASLVLIPLIALALNGYHTFQNITVFHNPLGSFHEGEASYTVEAMSFAGFWENFFRNILVHWEVQDRYWNKQGNEMVKNLFSVLHLNLNNPQNTWSTKIPFSLHLKGGDENYSGNPTHAFFVFLGLLLAALLFLRKLFRKNSDPEETKPKSTSLLIGSMISFFFFCLFLKWQPWHSRLHTFFFIPSFIFCVEIVSRLAPKKSTLFFVILSTILFMQSSFYLSHNVTKNVSDGSVFTMTREEKFLISALNGDKETKEYIKKIKEEKCEQLKLVFNGGEFQYPLWALLDYKVDFRHEFVMNETKSLEYKNPIVTKQCYLINKVRKDYWDIIEKLHHFKQKDFTWYTLLY